MAEENMPAADAASIADDERVHYELAFHLLPTAAEEEVQKVFEELKALITKAGGDISDEEVPKNYELAYTIEKILDGRRHEFASSYFGWVRFRLDAEHAADVKEAADARQDVLRYIIVRLTKEEEMNPYRVHDIAPVDKEYNEDDDNEESIAHNPATQEETAEVKEEELEESLEKITS